VIIVAWNVKITVFCLQGVSAGNTGITYGIILVPIAHMDVNILLILMYGALVGFLSGLVGVGGGFLITPLLIFTGVPPIVAVSSGAHADGRHRGRRKLYSVALREHRFQDGGRVLLTGSWLGGGFGFILPTALVARRPVRKRGEFSLRGGCWGSSASVCCTNRCGPCSVGDAPETPASA